MAKELPYFKFIVAEYLLGRISGETFAVKGMFLDACSHYWHKDCGMTRLELNAKLGKRTVGLLIDKGFINSDGLNSISIPFLDEQFNELYKNHSVNSKNGTKGAAKRWGEKHGGANGGAIERPLAKAWHLDKDKEEDKIKIKKALLQQFFDDLENSIDFETIAMNLKIEKEFLKTFIPGFRLRAELKYPTFDRFVSHFKNYVLKQIEHGTNNTTTQTGNRNYKQESLKELADLSRAVLNTDDSNNG